VNIVEFITARLDEDEALARRPPPNWRQIGKTGVIVASDGTSAEECGACYWDGVAEHIVHHDPARVLAEVKAKRAIVQAHQKFGLEAALVEHKGYDALNYHRNQAMAHALNVVLRYLALPYADHPDYDPAWRVDA